ncbi:MAG: flagellar basal body P-ring formation chaperone FlgA [Ignavibacteriaceae bacterium]
MLLNSLVILYLFFTSGSNISEQVDSFFKNALSGYDSFEVEMISTPADIKNIRFLSNQFEKNKSIVSLPAEIELNNGEKVKTFLSFRLKLYKKALFADITVERNQELRPEYFVFKKLEVNNINGSPVFSTEYLTNTISKKRLFPGEILLKEMIAKAPVITAGSKVKANVISGTILLSFDAVSRQDGCENEIIRIISRDKILYKARVIDSLNVSVIE